MPWEMISSFFTAAEQGVPEQLEWPRLGLLGEHPGEVSLTACRVLLQAARTISNTPHLWLCLHHLAMGLSSQPQSLQLLFMDEEPISCWGTVLHVPKRRGPAAQRRPVGAGKQSSIFSFAYIGTSVVILDDMPSRGV